MDDRDRSVLKGRLRDPAAAAIFSKSSSHPSSGALAIALTAEINTIFGR
jgi:hypothetical protein